MLFGTPVAETILASAHVRAHQQAGHMDASDLIKALQNTLRGGGRPHMGWDARSPSASPEPQPRLGQLRPHPRSMQQRRAWHKIVPRLAVHHTVVAVDLRGAGYSDKPLTGFDKATLAGDVHATMAALGFPRYAVCGHDIGAMVALALACTHRDAVTHVAVMDTAMPGWSRWESMFADPRLWHYAFHMKRDLPERLLAGREYDYVATFILDRAYNLGGHAAGEMAG